DLGQLPAPDVDQPGAGEPGHLAGAARFSRALDSSRRDRGIRRLRDGARRRRHRRSGRGGRPGVLPGPAKPLQSGRVHHPRPSEGAVRSRRRRIWAGSGAVRGAIGARRSRNDLRPAAISRTGIPVSFMTTTRNAFWMLAALALAATACKKGKAGAAAAGGGGAGGPPMGMPVEVVVARTDTVRDEIAATGQIEAMQSIDLRPEVDGRIVEFLIREGQEVDQGTPLFKVDDAQLKAQVAQLAAQRDLAQQALARAKELAQQNASSAADLEQAEASERSAQAQFDLQSIRLERTTVRAPFAGGVGQRYVSLGDYVNTDTKLVSLHTVNPQRAAFQVPEKFARQLR